MRNSRQLLGFFALLAFFLLSSAFDNAYAKKGERNRDVPKKLRVIALSDLHGELEPTIMRNLNNEIVPFGGAEYLSSYIQILKGQANRDHIPTVIVDAGDLFQGTIISNREEGKPVIKFYNYLGVDAATIGNHEFDYGPEGEFSVPTNPGDDPQGALKKRISEARFPFVAVNIVHEDGSRPDWVKPSVMIEKEGVRIGIVGAAEEATPQTTQVKNLVGLKFLNAYDLVVAEARKLRKQGADFVILTIHEGAVCDELGSNEEGANLSKRNSIEDLSKCKGELIDLVQKLPAGLFNAIIGGHTHHAMVKRFNNMALLQVFPKGKSVAWTDVSSNPQVTTEVYGPQRICGKGIHGRSGYSCSRYFVENTSRPVELMKFLNQYVYPDNNVLDLLERELRESAEIRARIISNFAVEKSFERSYYDESALGNFVADMMLAFYGENVDAAFTNNGGLRENLYRGPLDFGAIFDILPFDNKMAIMQVRGKTIKKFIQKGIGKSHSGLAWSGITYIAQNCDLVTVKIRGQELLDNKMYRVATSDYLAGGGGGFSSIQLDADEGMIPLNHDVTIREAVEHAIGSLQKNLLPQDYFLKSNPRQVRNGVCR